MDLSPWLTLRQVADAAAGGRPDDAHRLLAPLLGQGYRKAVRLAREVAKGYCQRAAKALDRDLPDAAWRDLLAAESLNTGERAVADLRQTLTKVGLAQARAALEAGDPAAAAAVAAGLRERGVQHPELVGVETAAREWAAAAAKADRGEFEPALDDAGKVGARLPAPPAGLDRFRAELAARHRRFLDAVGRAQEAAAGRRWRDAVAAADEALAAAPEYHPARTLRTKAWQAAAPADTTPYPPGGNALPDGRASDEALSEARPSGRALDSDRAAVPRRFLLWVDGVGGYLVCTGSRVTFGQAAAGGGPVDVPLFAEVSRVHAEVSRDGEGYVIEAGRASAGPTATAAPRAVRVNDAEAARAVLAPGDRVTLGPTCQFTFSRPVGVSGTACLKLTSGHRLTPLVEGVLLMANELILGPGPDAHVVIPDAPGRVLLYRSRDGLGVRVPDGRFRVNDRPHDDRAPLPLPAGVETDTLTFSVEPVGRL